MNRKLVKNLFVHDFQIMLRNNNVNLRTYEIDKINHYRVNVCFTAMYKNIVIHRDIKECFLFLYLSFKCSPNITIIKFFKILFFDIWKKLYQKLFQI